MFKTERVDRRVSCGCENVESEHEIVQVTEEDTNTATIEESKVLQILRQKAEGKNQENRKREVKKRKEKEIDMAEVLREYRKTVYQKKLFYVMTDCEIFKRMEQSKSDLKNRNRVFGNKILIENAISDLINSKNPLSQAWHKPIS